MLVREIKKEDIENCSDLYSRVFSGSPWSEAWDKYKAYSRLNHFFKSEGFFGILAEKDTVLGFILGNTEPFVDGDWFYLREMCVDSSYQGKGIGTMLLTDVKEMLLLKSVKNIYLATERDMSTASFYKKNGFLQENKMGFYYYGLQVSVK